MAIGTRTQGMTAIDGYNTWAQSYDQEANPMLSLERRILERLLPPLAALSVIDFGCGTGRWLTFAKEKGAKSLLGIDPSIEMLKRAAEKLGNGALLACADYQDAAVERASADIVFSNFVLSYIEDAERFLRMARGTLREGGSMVLSDIHPATIARFGWKRGLRAGGEFHAIQTSDRTLSDIITLCRRTGFDVLVRIEPPFGNEERAIFADNGKEDYFEEILEYPAIYVLQLAARTPCRKSVKSTKHEKSLDSIEGGRVALGPTDTLPLSVELNSDRICSMGISKAPAARRQDTSLDMGGYLVLPGLVNAHDHLEFALFPRMGRGGYRNFLEWADDLHQSCAAEISRQRRVPKDVRLWWGAIRNLLCGVTTVCHHNPYDTAVFDDGFPIRVLQDFDWAHSLALDRAHVKRAKASGATRPFFLHLGEGIDKNSAEEIFELARLGALGNHTVVIHGVALDDEGRELLQRSGAGLVCCPSSNQFLFGKTIAADKLKTYPRAALGSDSPLTAQGDLLDEARFACESVNAASSDIYNYVTSKAAELLQIKNVEANLRAGAKADLIAIADTGLSPAATLASSSFEDIELVIVDGRVNLASSELKRRLPHQASAGLEPLLVEHTLRWVRAPLKRLFDETWPYLGSDIFIGGKRIRSGT